MFELLPIGIAFVFGILSVRAGLPPLVGYLFAGFFLSNLWAEGKHTLGVFSEFGITILLFSIGLKLRLRELARREVFGTGLVHFVISLIFFFALFSIPLFRMDRITSFLVAFSLTFSSTVFVVKLLEQRGDLKAHYGRISIGILIIQDIIAVLFLAISANKIPSWWALALLAGLWPLRILLQSLFNWVRHGELLVLMGVVAALSGAFLFDQLNIKGDLGAMVFGYLLSSHSRATELNKALMSFKDFFLLGFFLSIGMNGVPTLEQVGVALLFCLALPLRSLLYHGLLNRSALRSRTSLFSSASLFTYSEFGLIVMAVAAASGWISSHWMSVLALSIAFSYLVASLLNENISKIYRQFRSQLKSFERKDIHPMETEISLSHYDVAVLGLGRVGKGAYQAFRDETDLRTIGFDYSAETVAAVSEMGFRVRIGDATSPDFWSRVNIEHSQVRLFLLAMPLVAQNVKAAEFIRSKGYRGAISSIAKHQDEVEQLQAAGVNRAFYLYAEAGLGFAKSSKQLLS